MSFANGGMWKASMLIPGTGTPRNGHRVYDETAAYLITDILKDEVARRPAFGGNFRFPFPCAVKTGTTKDYRDNWTVGYTTRYTIGVWVGNFDGEQMRGVSGVSGAGPIFTDIVTYLHTPPYGQPPAEFPVPGHLHRQPVCGSQGSSRRPCAKKRSTSGSSTESAGGTLRSPSAIRCASGGRPEGKRTYQVFPPEYRLWAASEGVRCASPGGQACFNRLTRRRWGRAIVHCLPQRRRIFQIDPVLRREYQKIRVAGFIPRGVTGSSFA